MRRMIVVALVGCFVMLNAHCEAGALHATAASAATVQVTVNTVHAQVLAATKPTPPPKPPPEQTNTGQTCVLVAYGAIQANQLTDFSVNTGVVYNIMVESNPNSPPGSVTYMEVTGNAYGWVWGWVGHDTVSYIPLVYQGHFYAPAHNLGGSYTLIEANHGMSYPFTCPTGMFPQAKQPAA